MNNVLHFALVLLSVYLASYFLTGRVIRFAQQRQLFDLPNQRSSHSLPTPRGGGLAIVAVFFLANIYAFLSGLIAVNLCVALLGSGLMVAIVGWIDDRSHVAVHIRLAVQFAAAIWGMYWLGMFSAFAGIPLVARWLCYGFVLLYLVWVLNLYNFMDGINGIAGVEAITVCMGAILFIAVSGGFSNAIVIPSFLLFSVAGFLVWNFPSAKVFMGDVGSGFIGLTLALLSLNAATIKFEFFFGWLILLGIFIADATLTLLRRIFRRQRFYEAHCSHAYQHAARHYASHTKVTLACGIINLVWLLPVALLVVTGVLAPVAGVIIAYLPLCIGAFYFNAGLDQASG